MQQDDAAAVGGAQRLEVHVGHPDLLARHGERQELQRAGIRPAFQAGAERLRIGVARLCGGSGGARDQRGRRGEWSERRRGEKRQSDQGAAVHVRRIVCGVGSSGEWTSINANS